VKEAGVEAAKPVSNWVTTELMGRLKAAKKTISESPVPPKDLAKLVGWIQKGTISNKIATVALNQMFKTGKAPDYAIFEKGGAQINDDVALSKWCEEAITEMPNA